MNDGRRRPIPPRCGPVPRWGRRGLDLVAAAYTGVLVYATHHPRPAELVGPDAPGDKSLHLIAYTVLGALVAAAVASRGGWGWRSAAALLVPLAIFAALDEVTQPFFGRFADPVDWACDEFGLVVGIGLVTVGVGILRLAARRGPSARAGQ